MELLSRIRSFKRFFGILYNHNTVHTPDILFSVVYHDGSRDTVRGRLWIHREPQCIRDLFYSHIKISAAKELVPWEVLSKHIRKEEMLRIVVPPYLLA